jgi:hypothetical protein
MKQSALFLITAMLLVMLFGLSAIPATSLQYIDGLQPTDWFCLTDSSCAVRSSSEANVSIVAYPDNVEIHSGGSVNLQIGLIYYIDTLKPLSTDTPTATDTEAAFQWTVTDSNISQVEAVDAKTIKIYGRHPGSTTLTLSYPGATSLIVPVTVRTYYGWDCYANDWSRIVCLLLALGTTTPPAEVVSFVSTRELIEWQYDPVKYIDGHKTFLVTFEYNSRNALEIYASDEQVFPFSDAGPNHFRYTVESDGSPTADGRLQRTIRVFPPSDPAPLYAQLERFSLQARSVNPEYIGTSQEVSPPIELPVRFLYHNLAGSRIRNFNVPTSALINSTVEINWLVERAKSVEIFLDGSSIYRKQIDNDYSTTFQDRISIQVSRDTTVRIRVESALRDVIITERKLTVTHPDTVVPDVVGMVQYKAWEVLKAARLKYHTTNLATVVCSWDAERYFVEAQNPVGGVTVPHNTDVALTIRCEPEPVCPEGEMLGQYTYCVTCPSTTFPEGYKSEQTLFACSEDQAKNIVQLQYSNCQVKAKTQDSC